MFHASSAYIGIRVMRLKHYIFPLLFLTIYSVALSEDYAIKDVSLDLPISGASDKAFVLDSGILLTDITSNNKAINYKKKSTTYQEIL